MRRWNGWGDSETVLPVSPIAIAILKKYLGELVPYPDISFESLLQRVGESKLPNHPLVETSPQVRLTHARGQSLPDWVALRYGFQVITPDGVAFPNNAQDICELFHYASKNRIYLIPYGGGTSVVGHINPLPDIAPVLTISLEKMNRMVNLNEYSRVATFQAGVNGPYLEKQLHEHGYTLGHFPQSFEYSTLGGWIATRSSGQQSYYYGRIEHLFAGAEVETPSGSLEIAHYPASAAGPDLREVVLGSEGRLGVITQATVRIRPIPEDEAFLGIFFPTWEAGVEAVHQLVQQDVGISMLRLSNPLETDITLYLSGKSWIEYARHGLGMLGYGPNRCLLIFGVTGTVKHNHRIIRETIAHCRRQGGLYLGKLVGNTWEKNRFLSPYLRNSLWDLGVAVDTMETALPWSQVFAAEAGIIRAIQTALDDENESVLAFAHLSHVYRDGASIYITCLFRRCEDAQNLLERWTKIKHTASQTIQFYGGTISHQHGVGIDHLPYLEKEKGKKGIEILGSIYNAVDPFGMMNPGKLI